MLLAVLDRHGLMPLRIEGLARRVDDLDPPLVESAVQLPQCGLGSFQQGRTGSRRTGVDPALKGVADGDQFMREALDGELARIFNLALAALAEILQFRHRAQIGVPVLGSPGLGRGQRRRYVRAALRAHICGNRAFGMIGFVHKLDLNKRNGDMNAARSGFVGGYLRAFKAEPSSFAVTSTMGMTLS